MNTFCTSNLINLSISGIRSDGTHSTSNANMSPNLSQPGKWKGAGGSAFYKIFHKEDINRNKKVIMREILTGETRGAGGVSNWITNFSGSRSQAGISLTVLFVDNVQN